MTESQRKELLSVPEVLVLKNDRVQTEVHIEGADLKSLVIDGEEIIFSPKLENLKRGGVPVLGPTPGPIKGTDWEHLYPKLPSHGTDRTISWQVDQFDEGKIVLKRFLGPNEFLFAGEIQMEIALLDDGVKIAKRITNFEDKPREIGHALHPYLSKHGDEFDFDDEVVKKIHPLVNRESKVLSKSESNGMARVSYRVKDFGVVLEADPVPTQWVFWTDDLDKYECVEPWWAEVGKGDVVGSREIKEYSLIIRKL
ncbi:hypothetical protein KKG65_01750 [Patescibacteria group bacterium]|nr:hypothetical protein [Patescibacteria group bacterium]